jgi:hypothetical protein
MVQTVSEIVARIESGKPFSWVRYGNGEWDAALGLKAATGTLSQKFSEPLRQAMRETVIDHHGKIMAMQNERYLRKVKLWPKIQAWLQKHRIVIDWQPGDVLHHASGAGTLAPFVQALRNPVFVGPSHFQNMPIAGDFLPVRDTGCWDEVDRIEAEMRALCQGRIVCVSAGPTTKVLIHRLRGEDMQLIDCGSLWDVYCGIPSRKYQRQITPDILQKNLGRD